MAARETFGALMYSKSGIEDTITAIEVVINGAAIITASPGYQLAHPIITPTTVTITYTGGGTVHTMADTTGLGVFSGTDAATYFTLGSCSIVYATGKLILVQADAITKPVTNVTIGYKYDSGAKATLLAGFINMADAFIEEFTTSNKVTINLSGVTFTHTLTYLVGETPTPVTGGITMASGTLTFAFNA